MTLPAPYLTAEAIRSMLTNKQRNKNEKRKKEISIKNRTWNGYFVSSVRDLFLKGVLCDAFLSAENQNKKGSGFHKLPVHKCVLGAVSDHFKALFTERPEEKHFQIPGVSLRELTNIVFFIYCGEISIKEEEIIHLYRASIFLKADSLAFQITRCVSQDVAMNLKSMKRIFRRGGAVTEESIQSLSPSSSPDPTRNLSIPSELKTSKEISQDIANQVIALSHRNGEDDTFSASKLLNSLLSQSKQDSHLSVNGISQEDIQPVSQKSASKHSDKQYSGNTELNDQVKLGELRVKTESNHQDHSVRPNPEHIVQEIKPVEIKPVEIQPEMNPIEMQQVIKPVEIKPEPQWLQDDNLEASPMTFNLFEMTQSQKHSPQLHISPQQTGSPMEASSASSVLRSLLKKKDKLQVKSPRSSTTLMSILQQGERPYWCERGGEPSNNSSADLHSPSSHQASNNDLSSSKALQTMLGSQDSGEYLPNFNITPQTPRSVNKRKSSLRAEEFMKQIIESERKADREIVIPSNQPTLPIEMGKPFKSGRKSLQEMFAAKGLHADIKNSSGLDNLFPLSDEILGDIAQNTVQEPKEKRRKSTHPRKMPAALKRIDIKQEDQFDNRDVVDSNPILDHEKNSKDDNHPILFSILKEHNAESEGNIKQE